MTQKYVRYPGSDRPLKVAIGRILAMKRMEPVKVALSDIPVGKELPISERAVDKATEALRAQLFGTTPNGGESKEEETMARRTFTPTTKRQAPTPEPEVFDAGMEIEIGVEITPEKALEILEKSKEILETENRAVSQYRVQMFAEEIRRDKFTTTHQGIALDKNGRLLDGQHRMWAVVEAQKPVRFVVTRYTRDLTQEELDAFDRGRARTIGDILHRHGEKSGNRRAGVMRMLIAFVRGNGSPDAKHGRVIDADIIEYAERYKADLDWFIGLKKFGKFASAPIAACIVYAHSVYKDEVEALAQKLLTGEHIDEADPMGTLRDRLIRDESDIFLRRYAAKMQLMRYTFNALAHAVKGEKMLRVSDNIAGFEFFRKQKTAK